MGRSCYPISAGSEENGHEQVGTQDQLIKISEALPATELSHVNFVESPKWFNYLIDIKKYTAASRMKPLEKLLEGCDPELSQIICKCLQLNPAHRPTAEELKKNLLGNRLEG